MSSYVGGAGGFSYAVLYSAAVMYDTRSKTDFSAVQQVDDFYFRAITYPIIGAVCWPVVVPYLLVRKLRAPTVEPKDDHPTDAGK